MLDHFKDADKKSGQNTILYDDPESTALADKEVIKKLNEKVKEDPDYEIPEVLFIFSWIFLFEVNFKICKY